MQVEVKKQSSGIETITITLPVQLRASKTGKSTIVAGTSGFVTSNAMIDGKQVKISVNAII